MYLEYFFYVLQLGGKVGTIELGQLIQYSAHWEYKLTKQNKTISSSDILNNINYSIMYFDVIYLLVALYIIVDYCVILINLMLSVIF